MRARSLFLTPLSLLLYSTFLIGGCGGGDATGPDPKPTTGSLTLQIQGLPTGAAASIQVSGPGNYGSAVPASTTLSSLAAGQYQVTVSPVTTTSYSFTPSNTGQAVTVEAGKTATFSVTYAATTGAMQVSFVGLPADVAGAVTVSGPAGFSRQLTAGARLDNITPGSYTLTPTSPGNVGLRYMAGAPASVTVTAGMTLTAPVTWTLPVAARSTVDRPGSGEPQIHIMYALPANGTDRNLDTDGTIQRTLSSAQRWLASQIGGRAFRLDLTAEGALDITFVRLPRADAIYAGYGAAMRDSVESDLRGMSLVSPGTLYLMYYDGVNTTACGSAPRPPALPGQVAGIYLKGTIPGAPACATNPFASTPTSAAGYLEFTALHEFLHLLGIVDARAPNHAFDGHVGHDASDLMYAGAQPWTPSRVDQLRLNYYNPAGLPGGLINLAQSPYLLP